MENKFIPFSRTTNVREVKWKVFSINRGKCKHQDNTQTKLRPVVRMQRCESFFPNHLSLSLIPLWTLTKLLLSYFLLFLLSSLTFFLFFVLYLPFSPFVPFFLICLLPFSILYSSSSVLPRYYGSLYNFIFSCVKTLCVSRYFSFYTLSHLRFYSLSSSASLPLLLSRDNPCHLLSFIILSWFHIFVN